MPAQTLLRWIASVAAALLALPGLYLLVALIGGSIAVHRDFSPTPVVAGGVPIYLRTNGVHADLVLPARWPANLSDPVMRDWSNDFPVSRIVTAQALRGRAWPWIAFGWGDRGFYLNTPRWRDLRWSTAWIALTGQGTAAMHVEYVDVPERFAVRRVDIDIERYRRLLHFIDGFLRRDAGGAPRHIDHPGYGATDTFYEADGAYTPWLTSNEWVRDALDHAGVRTARWAPFDAPLFWHLPGGTPRFDEAATILVPSARPGRASKETR